MFCQSCISDREKTNREIHIPEKSTRRLSEVSRRLLHRSHQCFSGNFLFCPSFFCKTAGKQRIPTEENLLFLCGNPAYDPIERFNRLGCAALLHSDAPSLMIMDELGPNEGKALDFQRAVFSALDGSVPILGVLQKRSSFFDKNSPSSAGACIWNHRGKPEWWRLVRHCRKILKIWNNNSVFRLHSSSII